MQDGNFRVRRERLYCKDWMSVVVLLFTRFLLFFCDLAMSVVAQYPASLFN